MLKPWMSEGLKKSSKQEQKLYLKYLKKMNKKLIKTLKTFLKNPKKAKQHSFIIHPRLCKTKTIPNGPSKL